ncbi:hypothetical protein F5Y06DRAFT_151311 [Hypoxylon sp. FL0890]|nr:hypothetical protein F5Y06DRAFT_151311 [Hypoxylon sp. FL0890]
MRIGRPKTRRSTPRTCACGHTLTSVTSGGATELCPSRDAITVNLSQLARSCTEAAGREQSHLTNSSESCRTETETFTVAPYMFDLENYQRSKSNQASIEPNSHMLFSSITSGQSDMSNTCACLSVPYLLLEKLRVRNQLVAPDDLALLRNSIETATGILNCEYYPLRYFSVIQNATLLGILCVCLAECYARILRWIDNEARRASSTGERKRLRIHGKDVDANNYIQPAKQNALPSFLIEVSPGDWKNLMRNAVRAEVFGVEGHKDNGFISFMDRLEERQRRWHQEPPAPDCPATYRSSCESSDQLPTCLVIIGDARSFVDFLDL